MSLGGEIFIPILIQLGTNKTNLSLKIFKFACNEIPVHISPYLHSSLPALWAVSASLAQRAPHSPHPIQIEEEITHKIS